MGSCLSAPTPVDPPIMHVYDHSTYENTPEYTLEGMRTVVKVLRILDGDTVDIALYHEATANVFRHRVRLYGIDTPEKRPPRNQPNRDAEMAASARSTTALRSCLEAIHYMPIAVFHRADKYGRAMCTFYDSATTQQSINERMIADGFACAYFGKTKKKFGEVEQDEKDPGERSVKRKKNGARMDANDDDDDESDHEDA